jgi:CRISPR-associated exonuclease Cas4
MAETKYAESDYIMISALQHVAVCPRQCALIHNELAWEENRFTAEGDILHERVDKGGEEKRGDLITARSVRLNHPELGITGIADMVEFRKWSPLSADSPQEEEAMQTATELPHRRGRWVPCPVEYKRGKSKLEDWDRVQLCAQAFCLESMFKIRIDRAALWYDATKSREWVILDEALREKTISKIHQAHELLDSDVTPPPVYDRRRCSACSLYETCRPRDYDSSRLESYHRSLFEIRETEDYNADTTK